VDAATANRDIVVIGASAGGVEALMSLLPRLPCDLPAAVFVCMHLGATSHLQQVLGRSSSLPVVGATAGAKIERGTIYVAVPGVHMLLHADHILLRRGPRENQARPAIDPLFRSAALTFGGRVIGVVLSGLLSDGTAGLRAIKRCGGLAIVQDPEEASAPSMPRSALRYVKVDHVRRIADMAELLAALVRQPAAPTPDIIPLDIRLETAIAAQELSDMKADDMLGKPSRFTCPECHGALWEIHDGELLRYRCHVGHAYAAEDMLSLQGREIDRLLGTLLRSHQERAALARRMAEEEKTKGFPRLAEMLEQRANDYEEDATLVHGLIRDGGHSPEVLTSGQEEMPLDEEQRR